MIKGWDIGVATMSVGEVARFIIAPAYAYGHEGFAPKVEPDETLDFEIELLSFKVHVRYGGCCSCARVMILIDDVLHGSSS